MYNKKFFIFYLYRLQTGKWFYSYEDKFENTGYVERYLNISAGTHYSAQSLINSLRASFPTGSYQLITITDCSSHASIETLDQRKNKWALAHTQ